mgnify:CR=1 FL=1
MTAFDEAWEIAKMARHQIGPTEIWDASEWLDPDEQREFLDEIGVGHTYDKGPRPEWFDEMDEEGNPVHPWHHNFDWEKKGRHHRVYVPLGARGYDDNHQEKVMMTPKQFLEMAYNTTRERLTDTKQLPGMVAAMKRGLPIHIANLSLERPWPKSEDYRGDYNPHDAYWKVGGHEGRHRMQALIDMGFGDVSVPVSVSTSKYVGDDTGMRRSPKFRELLEGALIAQQGSEEHGDKTFRINDFNDLYRRGESERLA